MISLEILLFSISVVAILPEGMAELSTVTQYRFQAPTSLLPTAIPSEQVAVVTGANQGLGFGIVKGLCEEFDGYIYLTARDKKKGADAVQALKDMKVCKHPEKLRFHEVNILNEQHIDDLYHHLKATHGGIDILINNAAIAYKRAATEPFWVQAENTIRTNYVGLVRTCVFLFPLLRRHARVVNLSSSAGHLSQITNLELKQKLMDDGLNEKKLTDIMYEFMDITKEHPKAHVALGWPDSAYAVSKIGVTLLTRIYQRQFDSEIGNQDKVINAVHPGYVATNMSSYMGNVNIFEAAEVPLYAALLPPNIASPRGELIWNDFSEVDIDSPTTPETDTDIHHYDIVEDIRHYANYTTTSNLVPFKRVLEDQDKMRAEMAKEEEAKKSMKESDTKQSTNHKTTQEEKSKGGPTVKVPPQGNRSARACRSVKDTSNSSSLSYRTIKRPILPEEFLPKLVEEEIRKKRETTLPGPRA